MDSRTRKLTPDDALEEARASRNLFVFGRDLPRDEDYHDEDLYYDGYDPDYEENTYDDYALPSSRIAGEYDRFLESTNK